MRTTWRARAVACAMAALMIVSTACAGGGSPAPAPAAPAPAAPSPPAAAAPAAPSPAAPAPAAASPVAAASAPSPTAAASPAAAAASPAPAAASPAPAAAGAATVTRPLFTVGAGGDVAKFDPHMSTIINDITISFNIFDNLILRRTDLQLAPSLATEWKTTDPNTWEFKLRRDVKFHNGDPFTGADVKFSIERTLDPEQKTLVQTTYTTVDRVETPDDYTVLVRTKQPDPILPARSAFFGGQIIPKNYFQRVGADEFNLKPIGTGPVKFVEWVKDTRLVLDANPDYFGGRIAYDRVIFRPIPETAARLGALQRGEIDLALRVPPDQVSRLKALPNVTVKNALFAGLFVLMANAKVKPLDNPKVRQAISLAIDRPALVEELWQGQGIVAKGPVAKGEFAYDESRPDMPFDPNRAKQLLREAGYNGEEIVLESAPDVTTNDRQMSDAVTAMFRDVGLNVRVEVIEASVRAEKLRTKSLKGLLWSPSQSTLLDPDGTMWRLLSPGGIFDYWRDEEFDRLGAEARVSLDEGFRRRAYARMSEILLEGPSWIPVLQPLESYALSNSVDWNPHPNTLVDVRTYNLKAK